MIPTLKLHAPCHALTVGVSLALLLAWGCTDDAQRAAPAADQADMDAPIDATDGWVEPDVTQGLDTHAGSDGEVALDTSTDSPGVADTTSDIAPDAPSDADATPLPLPGDYGACDTASCWETGLDAAYCGAAAVNEDFSTGLYNVHRYATTLYEGAANRITLTRTGGDWQPALIVAEAGGAPLFDGVVGLVGSGVQVYAIEDGTSGARAEIEILTDVDLEVEVLVTGWAVIDAGFAPSLPTDATYRLSLANTCEELDDLTAPDEALAGEWTVGGGVVELSIGDDPTWGPPARVDADAMEHVGFRLDFAPEDADVDLELLAWTGRDTTSLGVTDAGPGIRVLAGYDPFRERTFWVRARGDIGSGSLTVVRTPIEPGPHCDSDCGRLLQLPIPVDPIAQGFDLAPNNLFREQFGRRELLMALFHAGFRVAEAGYGPFEVQDISNWDGSQPCCHETHTGGYHADISLLTAAGAAVWTDPGADFGDEPMALLIAGFFEAGPYQTGHPAEVILDEAMHDDVRNGADALLERGEITAETRALFDADLGLIYHYPGHDNHIHVRVDR